MSEKTMVAFMVDVVIDHADERSLRVAIDAVLSHKWKLEGRGNMEGTSFHFRMDKIQELGLRMPLPEDGGDAE